MSQPTTFGSFSTTPQPSNFSKDFLESNSIIAKFAWLFLVIFFFVILLQIGTALLAYFFSKSSSLQKLFTGSTDAKQSQIFYQDPSNNPHNTINRSQNESDGLEFTWSTWIFINNLQYLDGQYRHIFHKGNYDLNSSTGLNFPNNAPGLYITPHTNTLVVIMNTFDKINKEITIPDIPLNKWVNVIIRCENKTLDVYVNGTITRSVTLDGVPKQNYGDVYVTMNGGFDGYVSNLWYYNYALGIAAIQNLVSSGPNTKIVSGSNMSYNNNQETDYLSLRWYFQP